MASNAESVSCISLQEEAWRKPIQNTEYTYRSIDKVQVNLYTEACRGGEKRETISPQSDFGGRLSPPKISRNFLRNFINFNRNDLIQCRVLTVKYSCQLITDH